MAARWPLLVPSPSLFYSLLFLVLLYLISFLCPGLGATVQGMLSGVWGGLGVGVGSLVRSARLGVVSQLLSNLDFLSVVFCGRTLVLN